MVRPATSPGRVDTEGATSARKHWHCHRRRVARVTSQTGFSFCTGVGRKTMSRRWTSLFQLGLGCQWQLVDVLACVPFRRRPRHASHRFPALGQARRPLHIWSSFAVTRGLMETVALLRRPPPRGGRAASCSTWLAAVCNSRHDVQAGVAVAAPGPNRGHLAADKSCATPEDDGHQDTATPRGGLTHRHGSPGRLHWRRRRLADGLRYQMASKKARGRRQPQVWRGSSWGGDVLAVSERGPRAARARRPLTFWGPRATAFADFDSHAKPATCCRRPTVPTGLAPWKATQVWPRSA